MMHAFQQSIAHIPLPEKFTYPFYYTPHPLCVLAAEEVKAYLSAQAEWAEELSHGKMFGVLLVQDAQGRVGYLAAFSGNLAGRNQPFEVPESEFVRRGVVCKAGRGTLQEKNEGVQELARPLAKPVAGSSRSLTGRFVEREPVPKGKPQAVGA